MMTKLKNKGYIYKVTNIITGQFYIGQRSSYKGLPEDDLGFHYFTSSEDVVKPLFKNNTSEWQKEILYRDIQYAETLDDIEGYAIHKVINDKLCLNGYDPSSHHGFFNAGRHMSKEARLRDSEAQKGKHHTEEAKAKTSTSVKIALSKPETIEKMRKAGLGHYDKVYTFNGVKYIGRDAACKGIGISPSELKRRVKKGLIKVEKNK